MLASARFRSPAPPPPQQRQSQSGLRELRNSEKPVALLHFLDELLDLEADYNATLTALLQKVSPVLDASNALPAAKKQTLFSNLRELQAFSSRFLEDLSRAQLPEHRGRIARIIQDALERSAAAYDLYYRRYALTADVVCQLTSDQVTSTLLKRLFSADKRIWPLNAAFGKPLQVFFNYKLLVLKLMDTTSGDTVLSKQLGALRDLLEKFLRMVYSARQAALDWEAMVTFEKQLDMSKLRDPKNPSIRPDTSHCPSIFTSSWDADELARRRMVMVESFTEVCPLLGWRMGTRSQLAAMVRPRGRINLHLFTDVLAVVRPMSRAEILKRVDNKTGYLLWVPIPLTDVEVGQYQYSADENIDLMIDGQLTLALQASSFAAKEKWLAEFRRLKEIMTDRAISDILTAMSAATLRNPMNQYLDGDGDRSEESEVPSRKARCRKNVGNGGGSWISGIKKAILKGGNDAKYKRDIFTAPSTTVKSHRLFEHHVVSSPSLGSVFTTTAVKSTDLPAPPLSATFPLVTRLFNAKGDGVQQQSVRARLPSMVVSMPVSLPGNHHQIPPPRSTSRAAPLEPTVAASRMSGSNSIVGLVCRIEDCVVSVWREPVWQSLKDERCRVEVKRTVAGRAFLVAAVVRKRKAELQARREVGAKDVYPSVDSWKTSRSNTSVVPTAHRPGRISCAVDQDEDDENERQVLNAWIERSTEAEMADPTTVSVGFTLNGGRTARYMVGCGSEAEARTLLESVRGQVVLAAMATEGAVEDSESPGQWPSQADKRSVAWLPSQGRSPPSPQLAQHGPNVISSTSRIFCSTPTEALRPTPLSPIAPHSPSSTMTTCSPPATPSSPARVRLLESRCKLYAVCADPDYWSPLGRGRLTVSASQAGRDYRVTLVADSGPLLLDVPYRSALVEDRPTSSSSSPGWTPAAGGGYSVLRRLGNGRFTITARQAGRRVVYLVVYAETPDSYDVLWRKAVAAA